MTMARSAGDPVAPHPPPLSGARPVGAYFPARGDDTVAARHDERRGVEATFEHGAPRRFELVVDTDGLRSRIRQLTFGPEGNHLNRTERDAAGGRSWRTGTAAHPNTGDEHYVESRHWWHSTQP